MREAVIVTAVRSPVGKAFRGAYRTVRSDHLAAAVVRGALERTPGLDPVEIDELILGCSFPEAEQGLNMGRQVALLAGLPESVPGVTVNRLCSSGLQAIAFGAQAIMSGMAEVVVVGGAESMTRVQGPGTRFMPGPELVDAVPDAYLGNGLTAEKVAERYAVSREDQDRFALESHRRASAAQAEGRFDAEILPVEVIRRAPVRAGAGAGAGRYLPAPVDGAAHPGVAARVGGPGFGGAAETILHSVDEGPRADTTLEALGALRPTFRAGGSVTAGNSSQMSDGAAVSVVMSAGKADALGLRPLGRFVSFATVGVDPGIMGIGPVAAIPKALRLAGISLNDVGLIELNEAFASQAVAVMRELSLDPARVNVNGGAIALGHPLGCTGAKLTATLLHEMSRRGERYGVVSMCIAGGMGAAAVFENLS